MTVKRYLQKLEATNEQIAWSQNFSTMADVWDACERGDWMEWLLNASGFKWTAAARAEYERITDTTWTKREQLEAFARAEYMRIDIAARAELAERWTEREQVEAFARAEYILIDIAARAEYRRIEAVEATALRMILGNPFRRRRSRRSSAAWAGLRPKPQA
jgi:transposase